MKSTHCNIFPVLTFRSTLSTLLSNATALREFCCFCLYPGVSIVRSTLLPMFTLVQNLQSMLVVFFHVVAGLAWKSRIDVSQDWAFLLQSSSASKQRPVALL